MPLQLVRLQFVPSQVLATFIQRRDQQIMGYELLAVVVGIHAFTKFLAWKCVRIWEDNAGAEGSLARGAAKAHDHNALVRFSACVALVLWFYVTGPCGLVTRRL